jgi:hypothetical protein
MDDLSGGAKAARHATRRHQMTPAVTNLSKLITQRSQVQVLSPRREKPQAYEIPRWGPGMGQSSRDRPEVTPKLQVAANGCAADF